MCWSQLSMPMLPISKELFIPVNGGKLFCRTFGEEGSPLVVLHGGPGLGQDYLLPQMAELGKFSFAIFYDQRGTGGSIGNDDWQANPFQTYVQDVNQLREAFGFKTISLLAHSWGGILASLYALAYPEHVDKVIYVNSVPVSSLDYLAFVKHRSQIVDSHKDELDQIRNSLLFLNGDPKTVENFYRIYFKNYFVKPDLANTLTLTMTQQAAINNFKIYNLFFDHVSRNPFDLYDKLRILNKSSLIIASDQDVIPLGYTKRLHESIPASQFVIIENSGHFPYIDQPDILFECIKNFI
jgi:proline iminopeptidase